MPPRVSFGVMQTQDHPTENNLATARPAPNHALRRRAQIARVHIARAALGMDDATYRAVIARVTFGEHTSSRDCSPAELDALLGEFRHLGWADRPAARRRIGKKPTAAADGARISAAQIAKIEALLADKARLQGAPVPWTYADAIARRVCGVERVQWLDGAQAAKVIAALLYDAKRMMRNAAPAR